MRTPLLLLAILVILLSLAACSEPVLDVTTPEVSGAATAQQLTNADWEQVAAGTSRYLGSDVDLTGQVFNLLGNYDDAFHFQMYTDPAGRKGNTHVAMASDGVRPKNGDQVRVIGVLEKELVTTSVAGTELHVPYVVASAVGPPGQDLTPVAASPVPTTSPASSPEAASAAVASPATSVATPAAGMPLRIEAESGQLAAPMAVSNDGGASGGAFVSTTQTDQSWNGIGDSPTRTGQVQLQVQVPRDGRYAVWTRMLYTSVGGNSYWLRVDGQPAIKVGNDDVGYSAWKWVNWHDGDAGQQIVLDLTAGLHTLTLIGREEGARMDVLALTDDLTWRPEGAPAPSSQPAQAPVPTAAPTRAATAVPTSTRSSAANVAPSATPAPPTATRAARTATPAARPTSTPVPATATRPGASPTARTGATPQRTATTAPTATPGRASAQAAATPAASPTRAAAPATPTPAPSATRPPSAPSPTSPPAAAGGGSYQTKQGDTLWDIAAREYGDGSQWQRLYDANRDKLSSPDHVDPNTQLRVPR